MLNNLFATFFFTGKSPYCPGTVGSLVSFVLVPMFLYLPKFFCLFLFFIACLGIYSADLFSRKVKHNDPKEVVIDEVVGQMLSFIFIFNINTHFEMLVNNVYKCALISFILFRIFDIIKPFPINFIDDKMKGGFAIMLDDILAALFVGLFYYISIAVYKII